MYLISVNRINVLHLPYTDDVLTSSCFCSCKVGLPVFTGSLFTNEQLGNLADLCPDHYP